MLRKENTDYEGIKDETGMRLLHQERNCETKLKIPEGVHSEMIQNKNDTRDNEAEKGD